MVISHDFLPSQLGRLEGQCKTCFVDCVNPVVGEPTSQTEELKGASDSYDELTA